MVKPESMKDIVEMSKGKTKPRPRKVKPAALRADIAGPTPEQLRHGDYAIEFSKAGQGPTIDVAYRRHPLFETLAKAKGSGIDRAGLEALRYYRDRHDETVVSPMGCALNVQEGSASLPSCLPPGLSNVPLEWLTGGTTVVEGLEAAIGAVIDTMRAVALEDRSYSEVAIARWGGREQSWILDDEPRRTAKKGGKMAFVERIVPRSGRHREIIRQEFLLGLKRLTVAHQLVIGPPPKKREEAGSEPAPVQPPRPAAPATASSPPSVDPRYLDEAGHMRPWAEIADIIRSEVGDDPE